MYPNASKSKRLVNFIIDYLIMGFIINFVIALLFYDLKKNEFVISSYSKQFIYVTCIFLYYLLCESVWNQTLGKKITKTKVVNLNNLKPNFMQIIIRSLSRLIPFYPITFLGMSSRGLHDIFSKTKVVNIQ
jgi:uncharacterized RDD family membrane protein YckC